MQTLFPGYFAPSDEQLRTLWTEGLIVLDANVLLNLYRYPETARQELLNVLKSVKVRLWVPYHAALEYHRNRLTVIADQKRRFHEVKDLAQKTKANFSGEINKLRLSDRHALINPDKVVGGVNAAIDDFLREIDELELHHQDVNKPDKIRSSILDFLGNNVGSPPDQQYIDKIAKTASDRFASRMPPGYMDADKAKSAESTFQYGGVRYERQHGDLIVWNQILDFAKDSGRKHILFVTDDEKDDWWLTVSSSGAKTIGPRPELVEEAKRVAGIEVFHMVKSSGFMLQSKLFLKSKISPDTIEQVEAAVRSTNSGNDFTLTNIESAVGEWLRQHYPGWRIEESFLPDYLLHSPNDDRIVGVEIMRADRASSPLQQYRRRLSLLEASEAAAVQHTEIVIAFSSAAEAQREAEQLLTVKCEPNSCLMLGYLEASSGKVRFVPTLRLST